MFGLSAFGLSITIATDSAEVDALLRKYLLPWLSRQPFESIPDLLVSVTANDGGYEVFSGAQLIARAVAGGALMYAVQSIVDEFIVLRARGLAPIHAGVVGRDGTVMLLPAPSHAGKSTLVARMIQEGWVYYSDEYALIDEFGLVHPYPRSLLMRNDSGELFPALAASLGAEIGRQPAPVRLIADLRWLQGGAWNVERLPQSETLMMLLKSTPREFERNPEMLAPLARVAAGSVGYCGVRGEASEASSRLVELFASLA